MGARIGVGNIAGVATAIMMGGPGAVFWMWIFAIIGSASSFMESTLAQIFKEKKEDGHFYGGPAYYASKGLGNRKLGIIAAVLLVLTFGVGFIGVQSCHASSALSGAFDFENNHLVFAIIIAALAALILFKGLKAAAKFSAKVVPIMAVLWIVFALVAICFNIGGVVNAIAMIFQYAFTVPSALGGAIGTIIVTGLKRGVFSNEAGLGSVANIAATANVKHPVKQGMIQSFGVLVDTLVVCTITAFVVLSYGNFAEISALGLTGANLVQAITADSMGNIANYIIALFMFIFAFTSLIGYYTMSESNARFIKDSKKNILFVRILRCRHHGRVQRYVHGGDGCRQHGHRGSSEQEGLRGLCRLQEAEEGRSGGTGVPQGRPFRRHRCHRMGVIRMVTIEQCDKIIPILGIVTIIVGVFTGYYFHGGENNLMFAPLLVGFVLVFVMYYFIDKRAELKAGKKVDEF